MSDPSPSQIPPDDDQDAEPDDDQITSSGSRPTGGIAIWSWDIAIALWNLVEDKSEPGYEPGSGPTGPGRYQGQTVRWASVPGKGQSAP